LNGGSIAVSHTTQLEAALTVTGFAYDIRDTPNNNLDHFARFALKAGACGAPGRSSGSLLCRGGPLRWILGGQTQPLGHGRRAVIVREAGGRITDLRGNAHSIYQPELVASNGRIHHEMLEVIGGNLRT
jgi:myo-inositol-1(or 4)-monophosphatase